MSPLVGPRRVLALTAGVLVGALAAGLAGPALAAAAVEPVSAPAVGQFVAVAQPGLPGEARHSLRLKVLGRGPQAEPLLTSTTASGYTPAQVRAYLGLTGTGAGQTIAIVTAYDAPTIAQDLATFNAAFGLPAPPSFKKVNQTGGTKFPTVNGGWALEAALDVQWAHAVAPAASLLLVEASSSSLTNLLTAVSYAAKQPGVTVVSGSFGTSEFARQVDQDYRCRLTTGVCVFASGDDGNPGSYPASNPAALAVGGTTLSLGGGGEVLGETAWAGSGGGVSLYSPKPAYQSAVSAAARRAGPDVSYAADPTTGFSVFSGTPYEGQTGWFVMGGTSAGAPQWAGVLAATAQLRKAARKPLLSAVSSTGATPLHTALYSAAVRTGTGLADITIGSNGLCGAVCTATTGFDTVTGLGSPRRGLDVVLRDLP